ncbi:ABC transporter ATP-binding protein [Nonomuraea sp. NPDC049486]|uniref:ABC transporter ATP-binding protein n=1 Tax=Nonomuraea sp. NPDC049486 TaxID=3155773 RepID=UPI00342A6A87
MLDLQSVGAWYGSTQVLFDIDLTVPAGQKLAIAGTNGAGKTTLLRSVLGLVKSRGEIRWEGRRIDALPCHRRVRDGGIAVVHEGRGLITGLSVLDNLTLGVDSAALRRLDEVFDAFPVLAERRNQPVTNLSGGEQQMVALGRTMLRPVRLLVIDEPSLGLAPSIVAQLYATIARMSAAAETTVLLVEQELRLACEIADRVVVLRAGRLVQDYSGSEVNFDIIVDAATGG